MGIKQPPSYVHPNKRKRQPVETKEQAPAPVTTPEPPKKEKREVRKPRVLDGSRSDQVRLVIYPPTAGQIAIYDEMIAAGYSSKQALLGLLKKGFSQFETDLLAKNVTTPPDQLLTDGKPVDTTRNVTPQFIEAAKGVFDPFDMLSDRALGCRIGEAVIRATSEPGDNTKR